jgi:hypothetical protein
MLSWLNIVVSGIKIGFCIMMFVEAIEVSDSVAGLLGGSLCMAGISWKIASRIVPDL